MIITIKRKDGEMQSPTITIDTESCHYTYALVEALELALRLDGHDEKTIKQVFSSIEDFKREYGEEHTGTTRPLTRFLELIPDDYFGNTVQPVPSRASIEKIACEEFNNIGDEGLFPNHTDKDIWTSGFTDGVEWSLRKLPT